MCSTKRPTFFPIIVLCIVFGWLAVNRFIDRLGSMQVATPEANWPLGSVMPEPEHHQSGFIDLPEVDPESAEAPRLDPATETAVGPENLSTASDAIEVAVSASTSKKNEETTVSETLQTFAPVSTDATSPEIEPTDLEQQDIVLGTSNEPLLPEDRPAWVAKDDLSHETHYLSISSLPAKDRHDALQNLPSNAWQRFRTYAIDSLELSEAALSRVDEQWVADNLLRSNEYFYSEREVAGDRLVQVWGRIAISPATRAQLLEWQRQIEWENRSTKVIVSLLSALAFIGLVHTGFAVSTRRSQAELNK